MFPSCTKPARSLLPLLTQVYVTTVDLPSLLCYALRRVKLPALQKKRPIYFTIKLRGTVHRRQTLVLSSSSFLISRLELSHTHSL